MSFELTTLGRYATVQGGFAYKSKDFTENGSQIVLKIKNIRQGFVDYLNTSYVSDAIAGTTAKWLTQPGDILISMTGSGPSAPESLVGRVARVWVNEPKALINQRIGRLQIRREGEIDKDFLFYLLSQKDNQDFLVANSTGSANQVNINSKIIESIACPKISFDVSKGIADLLNVLEQRIRLLRETNATLEGIAQALFKSWFVDFDPVRAKMEGRAPEGMDEATAALFPDGLEDSELGLVPKGWRVRSLDEIAEYLNGLALQKFPPSDDSWLPVIKIAQLRKGDTVGADRAGRNIKPAYVVQNGDVLFSWSGSLEVDIWCGGEGALNQHLFKVTSDTYPKWFYFLWTKYHLDHFRQIAASKATTMGHIQRVHLSQAKVVAPPDDVVLAVGEYFAPLLDRWISTALQARTLASLRDTLLPRLISGQLRLPQVDALIEETA